MTAHTRRNSTRNFGPFRRASARPGGLGGQVTDDTIPFNSFGSLLADHEGFPDAGYEGHPGHAGDAGREPELSGEAGEYAGRHARKRRVAKIVPAVAAVAAIAGVTAYGLSNVGHSQARQPSASMTPAGALDNAARSGTADAAGAMLIKVAKATDTARAAATHTAKPAPSHAPAAAPAAAATTPSLADAAAPEAAAANAPATQAPAPAATPTASQPATATTLSCNLNSGGLLPENVSAIVSFLLANGYSDNAAVGIAGNIYQESTGNPEAVGDGGGGLIGFTPLPAGYVTGDASADLQTQLAAVLTYNQIWSSYLPALNSAASPADAADIYVTDFERAGIPATATREASAEDVASACGI